MAPMDGLRRWIVIPAAIGSLAIAAFATRSTAPGLDSGLPDLDLLTPIEVAGYVALGVGLVLLPWVALERARRRLRPDPARRAPGESSRAPMWATALAVVAIVALALVQAAAIATYVQTLFVDSGTSGQPGFGGPAVEEPSPLATARNSPALIIALVILVGLAVLAVGVVIAWRRLDAAERGLDAQPQREALRETVEIGLDALLLERDPRRAVIAAYAAMEQSMSRLGLGRSRSEAPVEYLRRIIAVAPAPADAATISNLFQIAKFSPLVVDESMRQRAIAALEAVRSALAPGTANGGSPGQRHVPVP